MKNLAHAPSHTQGELVQFPRTGLKNMAETEEGYSRLPNLLIDTEIMADLNDKAFKCLVFILRQTLGFGRSTHTISISQFQKYCGIKKRDTVISCIQALEECGVINVCRKLGVISSYTLTLDQYRKTGLVPTKGTSTTKRYKGGHGNGDGTSTAKGDETSPIKRDTNKENIKENFKEKDNKKFTAQNRPLNFVEYHPEDSDFISFKDLCKKYPAQVDFQDQARTNFPNHSVDRIYKNLETMAQWSLDKGKHTPQKWMSIWLTTFMKNLKTDAEEQAFQQRKAKQSQKPKTNLDVNAAWEKAEYQPVSAPVDIPEDFL